MRPGHWLGVLAIAVVVVLAFVVIHSSNERHYNDCLSSHGIASVRFYSGVNPCHKSWP